ncbi:LuxR C-terminal-related transcriptional regulator [Streptomyces sp. 1331.2]|uniref:LuxR C-terminal-related transcriptional regulator n=1 Tax=Streptomyces sp. 1331.2 TaxID=1938835 RepID=UPI000BDBED2C|nr:LuxR C-terminal-related transcriptional regulator [Streptomyces sp. 1331.2]SOB88791.1 DNA-binding transcriptional regulator, CsgD family [Streptomyces sp. 1331.2]
MAVSPVERRTAGVVDRCYAGSDPARLRAEVLPRLRRLVPTDAVFFATVDPASLLFTSAVTEDPLAGETARFLENEFGRADVNKFADLARSADPVATLDRATRGERAASPRYREIMAPLGLGDELRVALRLGGCCWGVLCLHREQADSGFGDEDLAVLRAVAPHLAEGIRRSVALGFAGSTSAPPRAAAPGVLVLDAGSVLLSASEEARDWLARLDSADFPAGELLPIAVSAVAARLARLEQGPVDRVPPPSVRVRDRFGEWWSVHATRLTGPPWPQTAVIVEPAPPQQRSTLLLSAYGLSPAQNRVATLVLRGCSTREISAELCISANTVQEHLTAVFDRLGVRSRRELVALALAGAGGKRPARPGADRRAWP